MIEYLPHVNATLNSIAALLLVCGYVIIKRSKLPHRDPAMIRQQELRHKKFMISAFLVSTLFLASYLIYHANMGSRRFPREDYAAVYSAIYLCVLATHVVLAALVPFLAGVTIFLGLTDRRRAHRKLARWTFPIWLYVSVTGVIVYWMLYWQFIPVH